MHLGLLHGPSVESMNPSKFYTGTFISSCWQATFQLRSAEVPWGSQITRLEMWGIPRARTSVCSPHNLIQSSYATRGALEGSIVETRDKFAEGVRQDGKGRVVAGRPGNWHPRLVSCRIRHTGSTGGQFRIVRSKVILTEVEWRAGVVLPF